MCAFIAQKALKVTSESINFAKFPGGHARRPTSAADWPYHFLCASDGSGYSCDPSEGYSFS